MTGPVLTDDLVQGCVKYLAALTDVRAVLGAYPDESPWLFQHDLWVEVEGTGNTAAVIAAAGGWAGPNQYNTMRFPRISLEISADPLRDAGNNPTTPGEVHRRLERAFAAIDARLHRPAPLDQRWGTVRTLGCSRIAEPVIYVVPDGDGMLRLQAFYGVVQA